MKKALVILLAILFVVSLSPAQDQVTAGSKALLFKFGGLNTLAANAYIPSGIGALYFLNTDMAVRGGIAFGTSSTTVPFNPPAGNPTQTGSDGSTSTTAYGISADLLFYNWGHKTVTPYAGVGISLMNTSNDTKDAVPTGTAQTETKNAPPAGLTLGVNGILGVEYFIAKEISLGAEYTLGFNLRSAADMTQTQGSTSVTTKGGSSTNIGFGNVSLNLAVYM